MKLTTSRIGAFLTGFIMLCAFCIAQAPAQKAKPAKEPAAAKKEPPAAASEKHELLDLNSATKEQLMTLPGIGAALQDHCGATVQDEDRPQDKENRSCGDLQQDCRVGDC
jgi:hypothetical protein